MVVLHLRLIKSVVRVMSGAYGKFVFLVLISDDHIPGYMYNIEANELSEHSMRCIHSCKRTKRIVNGNIQRGEAMPTMKPRAYLLGSPLAFYDAPGVIRHEIWSDRKKE